MWFDDDPKIAVAYKIEDAIAAFKRRFKTKPNVVLVSKTDSIALKTHVEQVGQSGVRVQESTYVRRNNFWVGLDNDVEKQKREITPTQTKFG
jgi:hypothetical protein